MVLWDYALNEILARSLADGANLTVVFDCCHSGGTLKKSLTSGVDQMTKEGVARGSGISRMPVFGSLYDQNELRGNLLCLPKRLSDLAGESDPVLDTTQQRSSSVSNACDPHLAVKPTVYDFGPNCRVLCWAACSDIQRAYEDGSEAGGRFTRAFVEHLDANESSTYRQLNKHIFETFEKRNSNPQISKDEYQEPQLYTSGNMESGEPGENKFEQKVDI
ncbi:hypothetical protein FRC10_011806 [Ceratobasidium sp. 414]|nr:hypothetical protein FRC10_011806 [Ceratobasidium sp. 414]